MSIGDQEVEALVQRGVQMICWHLSAKPNATMLNAEAIEVLEEAAALKSADAHYYLGAMYFNGLTGEEQFEDAFHHMKVAYQWGHARGLQPLQSLRLRLQEKENTSLFTNFCARAKGYKALNDRVFNYIVDARDMATLQATNDTPVETTITQHGSLGVTLP